MDNQDREQTEHTTSRVRAVEVTVATSGLAVLGAILIINSVANLLGDSLLSSSALNAVVAAMAVIGIATVWLVAKKMSRPE